jgi:uncharacterized membrane protein YcfT
VAWLYAQSFVEPFGTLWFIYLLPVFFVVCKLTRGLPPLLIWLLAAGLEIAHIHTGWTLIDEFAGRFVYFYTGYILAGRIFALAEKAQARPLEAVAVLVVWAVVNGVFVYQGYADLPLVSLLLGLLGAAAIVRLAALLATRDAFAPLRYCGQHSIVIYLAFFLFMAGSRAVLLKTGIIGDIGTISLIVTLCGIVGPLLLFWIVRRTPLCFLFERPAMFWLTSKPRLSLQPAS